MKWYASAVYIYPLNLVLHERWVEEKISFFFGFLSDFSARSNMIGLEDHCVESTEFLDMAKINVRDIAAATRFEAQIQNVKEKVEI